MMLPSMMPTNSSAMHCFAVRYERTNLDLIAIPARAIYQNTALIEQSPIGSYRWQSTLSGRPASQSRRALETVLRSYHLQLWSGTVARHWP